MRKQSTGEKIFSFFNIILMLVLIVVMLYPLVYVLFASLSEPNRLLSHSGALLAPLGFTLGAYKEVLSNVMVTRSLLNTILYVVVGTSINMLCTITGAYALSRRRLWIKKYINFGIVITMFFQGGLIPVYLLVCGLGLRNTMWALILPVSVNTYNLIVLRTAFSAFPEELEEAAKIDGANDFFILFRLVVSLCGASIAVIVLFYSVQHWNSWFPASIYLTSRSKYPLQLYLREVLISSNTESMMGGGTSGGSMVGSDVQAFSETIKFSVVIVSTIPILCVYPFVQKYFVKGVMIGAVKG